MIVFQIFNKFNRRIDLLTLIFDTEVEKLANDNESMTCDGLQRLVNMIEETKKNGEVAVKILRLSKIIQDCNG